MVKNSIHGVTGLAFVLQLVVVGCIGSSDDQCGHDEPTDSASQALAGFQQDNVAINIMAGWNMSSASDS